jgi:hypothetical protein
MLAGDEPVDAVLMRVAQSLKECVGDVGDVSVSLVDDLGARTVVFTGASAVQLDEAQYELGHGPCLDAARGEQTVLVDTRSDTTYPQFSRLASEQGIRHSVSIGLPTRDRSAAGLNVYGTGYAGFGEDAMALTRAFANYALVAVSRPAPTATAPVAEWRAATTSRALVDRAVQVLMARNACSREQALQELLTRSRSLKRGLAETAKSIPEG